MSSSTHKSLVQINAEFLSSGDVIDFDDYDFNILNLSEFENSMDSYCNKEIKKVNDKVDHNIVGSIYFHKDSNKQILLNDMILISVANSICCEASEDNQRLQTSFDSEADEIGASELFGKNDIEKLKEIALKNLNKYLENLNRRINQGMSIRDNNKIKYISFLIDWKVVYLRDLEGETDVEYSWEEFKY